MPRKKQEDQIGVSEEKQEEVKAKNPNNVVEGPAGQKAVVSSKKQPGRPNPEDIDKTVLDKKTVEDKFRNHHGQTITKTFEITRTKRGTARRLIAIKKG